MSSDREGREVGAPAPAGAPEKVKAAGEFCDGLLARMGAQVDVEVRETPEAIGVSLKPREGNHCVYATFCP